MRVLVVEDQVELADDIGEGLRDRGFGADVTYDGASGIEKAMLYDYDVVVLDRDLPHVHGDAVCAALVGSERRSRILMLTAATTVDDRVHGLNLGADDYLTKPFAFEELVARIHALARRAPSATSSSSSTPSSLRVSDTGRPPRLTLRRALSTTRSPRRSTGAADGARRARAWMRATSSSNAKGLVR